MTTAAGPDDLTDLERAAASATPGPWCQHPNGTSVWQGDDWDSVNNGTATAHRHVCNATDIDAAGCDDMHLISLANPARILALVKEIRELRAKVATQAIPRVLMSTCQACDGTGWQGKKWTADRVVCPVCNGSNQR